MPGRFAAIPIGPTKLTSAPTLDGDQAHETSSTIAARVCEIPADHTLIRAGQALKPFTIQTSLLMAASPFFAEPGSSGTMLRQEDLLLSGPADQRHVSAPIAFPDTDEFAFPIFRDWIHGKQLMGPSDFHSMTHYLSLYILAIRFEIEALQNQVMDQIRTYYEEADLTAPAFRLEYIYANTEAPNLMRDFLVHTAASRAFIKHSDGRMIGNSDSIRNCLRKGGDLAVDYCKALIDVSTSPGKDVRCGDPCEWHEHKHSERCSS